MISLDPEGVAFEVGAERCALETESKTICQLREANSAAISSESKRQTKQIDERQLHKHRNDRPMKCQWLTRRQSDKITKITGEEIRYLTSVSGFGSSSAFSLAGKNLF